MKLFLDRAAAKIISILFTLFVILYSLANLFFTVYQCNLVDNSSHYRFNTPLHYGLLLVILLLIFFKKWRFSSRRALYLFLTVIVLFGFVWVLMNPQGFGEYADPYNVYRSARQVAHGDYSVLGYKSYINTYPNNLGLLSILVLYFKFFGEKAALFFRLSNVLMVAVGYLGLYKISERLFHSEELQRYLLLLFCAASQYIFLAYFVYGNAFSYTLGIVSCYFFIVYLQERQIFSLGLAILMVLLSILVKNNSLILLVAMLAYLVLDVCHRRKLVYSLLAIILLVSGAWLVSEGVIRFYEKRGEISYANRLPKKAWLAYGLNYDERHPGGYLSYFEQYHVDNDYVVEYTEEYIQQFMDGVLTAFRQRPYLIPLFYARKMAIAWADPEFEVLSVYRASHNLPQDLVHEFPSWSRDVAAGKSHAFLQNLWDGGASLIAIGLLLYLLDKKEKKLTEYFPAVIVIGGFLFHSFWEVKSIYLYQYYLFLLPYAAYGYTKFPQYGNKKMFV